MKKRAYIMVVSLLLFALIASACSKDVEGKVACEGGIAMNGYATIISDNKIEITMKRDETKSVTYGTDPNGNIIVGSETVPHTATKNFYVDDGDFETGIWENVTSNGSMNADPGYPAGYDDLEILDSKRMTLCQDESGLHYGGGFHKEGR